MSFTIILLYIIIILLFLEAILEKKFNRLILTFISEKSSGMLKDVWQIPGPKRVPLLGTKWVYFWRYKITKLHEAYMDLNRMYGDLVLESTPGGVPIVSLYDRHDLERVLSYRSKYPFRPPTEIVVHYRRKRPDRYASSGIINEQGPKWCELRTKLTQGITSPKIIHNFIPSLNHICDDFIELIRHCRDSENIVADFERLSTRLSFEAACLIMLGRRMGFLDRDFDKRQNEKIFQLGAALNNIFEMQRDSYYGLGLWKYLPTKTIREFSKSEDTVYEIISEIIDNSLKEDEMNSSDDDIRRIYLDILNTDLDMKEKKSSIIDFIAAAVETFRNTLIYNLFYILSNEGCQDRIYAELEYCGPQISHEILTKSIYLKACIQETYRISPIAMCIARILEEDMTLSGYQLKAGQVVLCHTGPTCKNPKNFTQPEKFTPDRWINETDHAIKNQEVGSSMVLPFGVGRRSCPAKRLVDMELPLFLAKLTQTFRMEFCHPLETEFKFLLAPKPPVVVKFKDRI